MVYTEALAEAAYIGRARGPLRNTGAAISPLNNFMALQSIETLPLRMNKHCDNAQKVVEYPAGHEKARWVRYAGLPDHPNHSLLQTYCGGKAAGLLSFGVGGRGHGRPDHVIDWD